MKIVPKIQIIILPISFEHIFSALRNDITIFSKSLCNKYTQKTDEEILLIIVLWILILSNNINIQIDSRITKKES